MKVVQINSVFGEGGSTGRIARELHDYLAQCGHESYAAFGYTYAGAYFPNTLCMNSIPALKVSILKTRMYPAHGFYNKRATKRLITWLDQIKPDVVHLHNLHGHYVNVEMLFTYLKERDIPVVWTLHDCWSFTGWCAYYDMANCMRWQTGCKDCPCKHDYPFTWFFDRSAQNYQRKKKVFTSLDKLELVCPSQWLADQVAASYLKEFPRSVINNGVDLGVFTPGESDLKHRLGIEGKAMVLALANEFSARKGVEHLVELSNRLDDAHALVILGAPHALQGASPSTIYLPRTNSAQELADVYRAADVFVNPTLADNLPTTNIEALACGTPVVTFNVGGSAEVVGDACGWIVERNDTEGFVRAVRDCGSADSAIRERCAGHARANYGNADCYRKYLGLYNEVLHG